MKRWMWILAVILGFSLLGETGNKVEELEPVQLLYVKQEAGIVSLDTDTGSRGRGKSLQGALLNMNAASEHRIFLETAEQLLLGTGGETLLPGLTELLRPAVRVIRTEEKPDLKKAASYLKAHQTVTTLADLRAGRGEIPWLRMKKGSMYLGGADGKTDKYLDPGRSRSAHGPSGCGNSLDPCADHRSGGRDFSKLRQANPGKHPE